MNSYFGAGWGRGVCGKSSKDEGRESIWCEPRHPKGPWTVRQKSSEDPWHVVFELESGFYSEEDEWGVPDSTTEN